MEKQIENIVRNLVADTIIIKDQDVELCLKATKKIMAIAEKREKEVANDICRILDHIESKDENTSMDQWRQYKHIRNAIRDKYVLPQKEEHQK